MRRSDQNCAALRMQHPQQLAKRSTYSNPHVMKRLFVTPVCYFGARSAHPIIHELAASFVKIVLS